MPYPPLDVAGQWAKTNQTIIDLVDYVPDDKLNWSPREGLWNSRGILLHIILSRHSWLTNVVRDGEETPDVLTLAQAKDGMREHLRRSWERLERFVSDPAKLDTVYKGDWYREGCSLSGHWIAFQQLEHDIHHRADIFHYLALLGIEHPEVGTP